jgi:hypothetical protein
MVSVTEENHRAVREKASMAAACTRLETLARGDATIALTSE